MTVYRTYIPRPPLADFVEMFWLYEGYNPPHAKERVLPNGSLELTVNLRDDTIRIYNRQHPDDFQTHRGCVIGGTHSEFLILDTLCQSSMAGVHFKPGGAFPFLTLPAGELHEEVVSLDTLWGSAASHLRDQLLEAETAESKFHILEQFLISQASRPLERHPAVAYALKKLNTNPYTQAIADLTEQVGLSSRQFIHIFRDEVGLTPKLFCRIRRFQQVLCLIGSGRPIDWAEIALSSGYYDQAHFIKDFRAFSGLNPTDYLTHRGEHLNHVPLRD